MNTQQEDNKPDKEGVDYKPRRNALGKGSPDIKQTILRIVKKDIPTLEVAAFQSFIQ